MKRILFILTLLIVVPNVTFAQSTDEAYRNQLLARIAELQAQIEKLQLLLAQKQNSTLIEPRGNFESIILPETARVKSWYQVSGPGATLLIDNSKERQYFSRFFDLVPKTYDNRFKELVIYHDKDESFDAFVETIKPYEDGFWRLGLRDDMLAYPAKDETMSELFVHELAHIIAYEEESTIPKSETARCHYYFDDTGCPANNSYFNQFVKSFWDADTLDVFVELGDHMWSTSEQKNNFVSTYARTSPEEDFAESFTEFVLKPMRSGDTIAEEKASFFYTYPDLVEVRAEIRSEL